MAAAVDTGGAAIVVKGVDVWAGDSPLILDVNWSVMPNERWAIHGTNGCGKSTLLRAISAAANGGGGGRLADGGQLVVSSSLRLGMLEQTAVSGADTTVREEVVSRMERYQAAKAALDSAVESCVLGTDEELECLEAAQSEYAAAGGYEIEARISKVLQGLGFETEEFDAPCSSFSGGWQMRIGLARLLLSEPESLRRAHTTVRELLIMDEPTNHLDAAARRWLGDYVGAYQGTVLVVSHDAEFLRRASNSIAEVAGGRLELYKSVTYDKFLEEREERQARVRATVEAQERERKRMQDFIDRMGAKASKATQAKDRQGKLERLAKQQAAAKALLIGQQRRPSLTLAAPPPCGMTPLALAGADIRHPLGAQDIITGADLAVAKGMRLILRGPNGAGKSTILKALAGSLRLGEGQRVADERLELGVFAQDLAQELPQDVVAFEYVSQTVRRTDGTVTDERCRAVMGALGLVGDKAARSIGDLSGGEKARVALATFCLTPCNVLLLDEPTNHLDVDAIAALLDAIGKFNGALVVVSHDRAFCEAIDATHVGYVADGKVLVEERSLRQSDFSELDRGVVNVAGAVSAPPPPPSLAEPERTEEERGPQDSAPKPPESLEDKIAAAEAAIEALGAERASCGEEGALLAELEEEKRGALQAEVEAWRAELEERAAQRKAAEEALEKAEYATIEADVAELEAAAAKAEAELQEVIASRKRLPQMQQLALVNAAAAARRAADDKMDRYLELEEMLRACRGARRLSAPVDTA
ncbi:hypothetical protein EMIHUDRAFT_247380 [Emiliania huxleyi CCMP1516]|uniref:ABC transporter domain-containing protein n=2 Tax=Emiliania huxleyi TaxID=2903 RepID=A0A0D3IMR3_EMIH1|nr:hypothetical protein EMIHUDRAFT_247380 [Emiliania huxleyi CCMP1516]EOD12548.1 hypothetical protein EMIHUDRAFT_247380 [Emiliania huxleyi CCMP1516]|eukprot:XP_005764977.1 hypothetical protein EMIHUDRAFT_247380 [Emiliania huxleyi CCMP1516]